MVRSLRVLHVIIGTLQSMLLCVCNVDPPYPRSLLSAQLCGEVREQQEEARAAVRRLEKSHMKEFRAVRGRICERIERIDKAKLKFKKIPKEFVCRACCDV